MVTKLQKRRSASLKARQMRKRKQARERKIKALTKTIIWFDAPVERAIRTAYWKSKLPNPWFDMKY